MPLIGKEFHEVQEDGSDADCHHGLGHLLGQRVGSLPPAPTQDHDLHESLA